MSKVQNYITQSLAAAGFAVINGSVAFELRPDIFASAQEAYRYFIGGAGDVVARFFPGSLTLEATIEGITDDVTIITKSADQLAERIGWITGRKVSNLTKAGEGKAKAAQMGTIAKVVPLQEVTRACGECYHHRGGVPCVKTGERVQAPNARRQCREFEPASNISDRRNGKELWPELLAEPTGDAA